MKFKKMVPIIAMLLVVFLAGCTKKENTPGVPPTVTLTDPANLGTGMVLNKVVKVTFSLPMDPSTFTATLLPLSKGQHQSREQLRTRVQLHLLHQRTIFYQVQVIQLRLQPELRMYRDLHWQMTMCGILQPRYHQLWQ